MPYTRPTLTARRFISIGLTSAALTACATLGPVAPPEPPPNTDIYIADLSTNGENLWIGILHPVATTQAYENQPHFSPDGRSLVYAAAGPSGKTDIWARTLTSGETQALTNTPTVSEYSPRLSADRQQLTYIQENEAGDVTELHAQTPGQNNAAPVVALKPLGYYAFLRGRQDVLTFLRGEPASLVHVSPENGESRELASNIGRALYAAPDAQSAYFTVATEDENFVLKNYDAASAETRSLFALPEGVQDYAVFAIPGTDLTGFFAGSGTDLMFRIDHPDSEWVTVADFSDAPFTDISRIAVNATATRVAFVTETKPETASK